MVYNIMIERFVDDVLLEANYYRPWSPLIGYKELHVQSHF